MFFGHTKSEYSLLNFENPWRKARKFAPPHCTVYSTCMGSILKFNTKKTMSKIVLTPPNLKKQL